MDPDHDEVGTPPTLDIPEDRRSGGDREKETAVGKLVKLRAFNIFAARMRDSIKDENPVANGHEVKKIMGQKWAQLAREDKREFLDEAQNENDMLERMPVDPNAPKRKRRRRTKASEAAAAAAAPDLGGDDSFSGKKRRGRTTIQEPVDDGVNGEASYDGEEEEQHAPPPKSRKVGKRDEAAKAIVDSRASAKHGGGRYGRSRKGSVDATSASDSGYLVTVRIGDTDIMFRGVLFDPSGGGGRSASSMGSDVAPALKLGRRHDGLVYPSAGRSSSSKQIQGSGSLSSSK